MQTETHVFICHVDTEAGLQHYATVLPLEFVFDHGLPAEAIVGVLTNEWSPDQPITPSVFKRNSVFADFMHRFIEDHASGTPGFQAEARRQRDGYVVIVDQRTPTPDGPVPPEDIIGVMQLKDGDFVPGGYTRNPNHRLLSEHGFFRLPPDLHAGLVQALQKT